MRKSDVQIGAVYFAKVSEYVVRVRLDETHPLGGWFATNLSTGRRIRVRTAARLRADRSTPAPTEARRWPDLSRTRAALADYDRTAAERLRYWDLVGTIPARTSGADLGLRTAEEADHKALIAVQEAYYLDTQDRNSRAHCSILDIATARRFVAAWEAEQAQGGGAAVSDPHSTFVQALAIYARRQCSREVYARLWGEVASAYLRGQLTDNEHDDLLNRIAARAA